MPVIESPFVLCESETMFRIVFICLGATGFLVASFAAHASDVDPDSGLIIAPGWEVVRAHCTACHSAKLVTQNSGTRETWEGIIRWMQETQGLWEFDAQTEDLILHYLSEHYGEKQGSRRPALY